MKVLVEGLIFFLKFDLLNLWLVLLWMNIGEVFLYKYKSGEKLFSMLILFIEGFFEVLICVKRLYLEFNIMVFIDFFDK